MEVNNEATKATQILFTRETSLVDIAKKANYTISCVSHAVNGDKNLPKNARQGL